MIDATRAELLVADSFRVRVCGGIAQARAFERHLQRFEIAATAAMHPAYGDRWVERELRPFLRSAIGRVVEGGTGFPRLELWNDARLEVANRPLPPLIQTIEMRTAPETMLSRSRCSPQIKGPNITEYAAASRTLGAEALLVDVAGRVLEGATTSLLWWHDATLHSVSERSRVDSITEALVIEIAQALGFKVSRTESTPEELAFHEVWAVNALHGIRPVTAIDNSTPPNPDPQRLSTFQAALDQTWRPIDLASGY